MTATELRVAIDGVDKAFVKLILELRNDPVVKAQLALLGTDLVHSVANQFTVLRSTLEEIVEAVREAEEETP